jgi:DNA polymerase (family 10)
VLSTDAEAVSRHVLAYPEVAEKLARGENKVSIKLTNRMQVDVRILEKKSYGAALVYFTGSKPHNIELRRIAREKGWTRAAGKRRRSGSGRRGAPAALGRAGRHPRRPPNAHH